MPVLFERQGRHAGQLVGRSPYLQPVHVEAPGDLMGEIAETRIDGCTANGLTGILHPAAGTEPRAGSASRPQEATA